MCCIMGYAGHDLPKETFAEYLLRTASRGPDDQRVIETEFGLLGFGRLAIMGLTPEGMQPFYRGADCVVCNGELYGFRPVKAELEAEGYTFASDSDCEIILPLYYKYGLAMFKRLDAEFAMILYDSRKKLLIAARDPIARCSTATASRGTLPLRPRRKTLWDCAKRSIRSRSAATTATVSLCGTATLPTPRPIRRMSCPRF